MSEGKKKRFVNSAGARLLSLCVAVGLAVILVYSYHGDVLNLVNGTPETEMAAIQKASGEQTNNPALNACLDKRLGDVEAMKSDGVLNDAQYASFKARAEQLCYQLNPSS